MDMSRGFLAHPGAPHQFRDTLPFTGEECCRLGEGFGYNANNAPPPYELVRRGVTQEEWNRFMQASTRRAQEPIMPSTRAEMPSSFSWRASVQPS